MGEIFLLIFKIKKNCNKFDFFKSLFHSHLIDPISELSQWIQ